jgi:hypothetical protein
MEGVIQGGWEFVWAVYGISWATIILYLLSLHQRLEAK